MNDSTQTDAPKAQFRIGGIYQTQGGEFRLLRAMPDGSGQLAIAVHIDPHTGRGEEGGMRCLADGKFPPRMNHAEHRAHLLPGEWIWDEYTHSMRKLWGPTAVRTAKVDVDIVDAEMPKEAPAAASATLDPITAMKVRDAAGILRSVEQQLARQLPIKREPAKPNPFACSPDLRRSSHQIDPAHGSALLLQEKS